MRESWRWFGPRDPVTLEEICQTGVADVVSALHDVPIGETWAFQAIWERQALIANTPPGLRAPDDERPEQAGKSRLFGHRATKGPRRAARRDKGVIGLLSMKGQINLAYTYTYDDNPTGASIELVCAR